MLILQVRECTVPACLTGKENEVQADGFTTSKKYPVIKVVLRQP